MKKTLIVIMKWLLLLGFTTYLVLALTRWNKETTRRCTQVDITVSDSAKAGFIGRSEVERLLRKADLDPRGHSMEHIDTRKIETMLLKNPFIDHVTCYKTAGDKVCIDIEQRLPLMRVIAHDGSNYFIDRSGQVMPRMRYAADLVVATGYISKAYAQKKLTPLGRVIAGDEFWNSQIEQIYVDSAGRMELTPRVGDHVIVLGAPDSVAEKLDRLKTFYTKVLSRVGWNKYSSINLEYSNQIICKKKTSLKTYGYRR